LFLPKLPKKLPTKNQNFKNHGFCLVTAVKLAINI